MSPCKPALVYLLVASAAISRVSELNNVSASMPDKCMLPSAASHPAQAWATSLSGQVKQLDVRPLGLATQFNLELNFQLLTSDWSACFYTYCHVQCNSHADVTCACLSHETMEHGCALLQ